MATGDIRVEIKDRTGAKVLDLTKFKSGISFDFARPGGCGSASFTLPWDFEEWSAIGALYEVDIYVEGAPSNPFWAGYIHPQFEPILSNEDDIKVSCIGWKGKLHDRLVDDKVYNATAFKAIMLDMLNTYAHSRIVINAANIGGGA
jgi:hypothetical protein